MCGSSEFLKSVNPDIKIYVVDPSGSGIFDFVKTNRIESTEKHFGNEIKLLKKSPGKTIAEGVGNDKLTKNLNP